NLRPRTTVSLCSSGGLEARREVARRREGSFRFDRGHRQRRAQIGHAAATRSREQRRGHLRLARRLGNAKEVVFAECEVMADEAAPGFGDEAADSIGAILRLYDHAFDGFAGITALRDENRHAAPPCGAAMARAGSDSTLRAAMSGDPAITRGRAGFPWRRVRTP